MKFSPKIHNRTRIHPAGAPNQELARTQSVQHIHTNTFKSSGTRNNPIRTAHPQNLFQIIKIQPSLRRIPQNGTFKGQNRQTWGGRTRGVSHLGVEVLHGDAGGHGGSGLDRVSAGTTGPCGFVATRGGKATRLVLIKKSGRRNCGRKQKQKRRRPVARRKASRTAGGERTAAAHSCGFALIKSLFSQS